MSAAWRSRPIRMGRFEGTLPDDPELLAIRARMIGRELHVK